MGVLKLTPWFPGDVKPVHVGVYETDRIGRFQYWNGKSWGYYMPSAEAAERVKASFSARQQPEWRGLSEKPS